MHYHSQQDYFAYEIPISDQTWQLSPGEEFFIGEIESNMVINPVFDAELIMNWQMPHPDQVHLSGEPVMQHTQFPFHAELTARRWPVPTANDSVQAPLNEGFLSETPSTTTSYNALSVWRAKPIKPYIQLSTNLRTTLHGNIEEPEMLGEFFLNAFTNAPAPSSLALAYDLQSTAALPSAVSEPLPSSDANATVTTTTMPPPITAPAHPITGRYPCSMPIALRTSGAHPIVFDTSHQFINGVHGLARVAPNGASASAGPSAHGTGDGSNVAGGAPALAGIGN
ncbi:hypothetical protein EAF00_000405 [Botryotinia globosa]|nr:hypothetical protein EAF00_000405 [Botryotinia globosa]